MNEWYDNIMKMNKWNFNYIKKKMNHSKYLTYSLKKIFDKGKILWFEK
jgi:hypothetical protein